VSAMEYDKMVMARTRERLANDKRQRQQAVATFIRSTFHLASDLERMLYLTQSGVDVSRKELKKGEEFLDLVEGRIRDAYREQFGAELGGYDVEAGS